MYMVQMVSTPNYYFNSVSQVASSSEKASKAHFPNTGEGMNSLQIPRSGSQVKLVTTFFDDFPPKSTPHDRLLQSHKIHLLQCALSGHYNILLTWICLILCLSDCAGGRYTSNSIEHAREKKKLRQLIVKISNNSFHQIPLVLTL